jgi:agmatine deiminase
MVWPSSTSIWSNFLPAAQRSIAAVATAIAAYEPVSIIVPSAAETGARALLGKSNAITFVVQPADDMWARDILPLFVVQKASANSAATLGAVSLNFNGWGKKQAYAKDAKLAAFVAAKVGAALVDAGVVGEGGGLETDGAGTVIACKSSWVNTNRNPGFSEDTIASKLKAVLGAREVLWLDGVKGQDITDGHVDTAVRFVGTAIAVVEFPSVEDTDPNDVWCKASKAAKAMLESLTKPDGTRRSVFLSECPVHVATLPPCSSCF